LTYVIKEIRISGSIENFSIEFQKKEHLAGKIDIEVISPRDFLNKPAI